MERMLSGGKRWRSGGSAGQNTRSAFSSIKVQKMRKLENERRGCSTSHLISLPQSGTLFSIFRSRSSAHMWDSSKRWECDCCSHLSFISPGRAELAAFCVISNTGLYKTASIGVRTIQGRFTLPKNHKKGWVKEHLFSMLMWMYCMHTIVFSEWNRCEPK